jgi:hypothetical protein
MKITIKELRRIIGDVIKEVALDEPLEIEIERLGAMDDGRYDSVEAFINSKLEDDEFTFSTAELQMLARKMSGQPAPGPMQVSPIKTELVDWGFKFVGREPQKSHTRGVTDNPHGRHPYADNPGGGSGFMITPFEGTAGLGIGAGPGAMGGKYEWDPKDPKNLGHGVGTKGGVSDKGRQRR